MKSIFITVLLSAATIISGMEAPRSNESEESSKQSLIKENAMQLFALSSRIGSQISTNIIKNNFHGSHFESMSAGPLRAIVLRERPRVIALSRDGDQLAVTHGSGASMSIFDGFKHTVDRHSDRKITGIFFIKKDTVLYTHEKGDGVMDICNGNVVALVSNFDERVRASLLSSNGKWQLLEGFDENQKYFTRFINMANGKSVMPVLPVSDEPINSFAASDNGMRFITTTKSGLVCHDLATMKGIGGEGIRVNGEKLTFVNGDVTRAGDCFLAASANRVLFYKDIADLESPFMTAKVDAPINEVRFCPTGKFVAVATQQGVNLWDWQKEQGPRLTITPAYCLAFNELGDTLALGTDEVVYSTSYRSVAQEMSTDEHELLKKLGQEPAEKVLAVQRWKTIFDAIKNVQLKQALIDHFAIDKKS